MPSLTWAALHSRSTTGGPIRTPKARCFLRCVGQRVQPGGQVVRGPVDDRPLGQVGEVAPDPRHLSEQHQPHTHERAGAVEPAQRLVAPLRLHRAPGGRLQEARRPGPALGGVQEAEVLARRDGPDLESGSGGGRGHGSRGYLSRTRTGIRPVPRTGRIPVPLPITRCRGAAKPCRRPSGRAGAPRYISNAKKMSPTGTFLGTVKGHAMYQCAPGALLTCVTTRTAGVMTTGEQPPVDADADDRPGQIWVEAPRTASGAGWTATRVASTTWSG